MKLNNKLIIYCKVGIIFLELLFNYLMQDIVVNIRPPDYRFYFISLIIVCIDIMNLRHPLFSILDYFVINIFYLLSLLYFFQYHMNEYKTVHNIVAIINICNNLSYCILLYLKIKRSS